MPTTIIKLDVMELTKNLKSFIVLIAKQHDDVKNALRKGDKDEAITIIDNHRKIQAKYDEIESDLEFLVTKAPVDKYLRRTLSGIFISTELLRISVYAKHIAKFIIKNPKMNTTSMTRIDKVHKSFRSMLNKVEKVISSESVDKAIELAEMDEAMDTLVRDTIKTLITSLANKKDENKIKERVFVLSVVNALERASDHIVNICEAIIYTATGRRRNL